MQPLDHVLDFNIVLLEINKVNQIVLLLVCAS